MSTFLPVAGTGGLDSLLAGLMGGAGTATGVAGAGAPAGLQGLFGALLGGEAGAEANLKLQDGETRFLESVSHDDIVAGKTQRSYFEKRFYPSMDIPNFPAGGVRDLSRFKPGYGGPEHLFTVDAALRRVSP